MRARHQAAAGSGAEGGGSGGMGATGGLGGEAAPSAASPDTFSAATPAPPLVSPAGEPLRDQAALEAMAGRTAPFAADGFHLAPLPVQSSGLDTGAGFLTSDSVGAVPARVEGGGWVTHHPRPSTLDPPPSTLPLQFEANRDLPQQVYRYVAKS